MPLVGCRGEPPHGPPSPSGKVPARPANRFRSRVQGRCPWWGAGVKPRMVPQAPAGKCRLDQPTASAAGSRDNVPGGVQGRSPAGLPKPQREIAWSVRQPLPQPGPGMKSLVTHSPDGRCSAHPASTAFSGRPRDARRQRQRRCTFSPSVRNPFPRCPFRRG